MQAGWTAREFRFTYQGFTAKYSCDGLSGRIKAVLLLLGARKQDLNVAPTGCTEGFGRATLFPGVAVKMHVLAPLDDKSTPDTTPVATAWRNVDISRRRRWRRPGTANSPSRSRQAILPLFTTRNVEYKSTCVPHQLTPGGTTLKADVLVTAQPRRARRRRHAEAGSARPRGGAGYFSVTCREMRRFFCRPASVALSATGCSSP